jgi:hypothetical protein
MFFKLARCGYTLRVTSQISYSPEYTHQHRNKTLKFCYTIIAVIFQWPTWFSKYVNSKKVGGLTTPPPIPPSLRPWGPFSLPSVPQDSMRSLKVWADYRRQKLATGVWGHALPGNFLNVGLWNSISCILRTHFSKKLSFSKQSSNVEICNKLHAKHSNTT